VAVNRRFTDEEVAEIRRRHALCQENRPIAIAKDFGVSPEVIASVIFRGKGERQERRDRNAEIRRLHAGGATVLELAHRYRVLPQTVKTALRAAK
jgi:hypothetical protein